MEYIRQDIRWSGHKVKGAAAPSARFVKLWSLQSLALKSFYHLCKLFTKGACAWGEVIGTELHIWTY